MTKTEIIKPKNIFNKLIYFTLFLAIAICITKISIIEKSKKKEIHLLSSQLKITSEIAEIKELTEEEIAKKKTVLNVLKNSLKQLKEEEEDIFSQNTYLLIILISMIIMANLNWNNKK